MKKMIKANPAIKKLYGKIVKTAAQLDKLLKQLNQLISKEKAKQAKKGTRKKK